MPTKNSSGQSPSCLDTSEGTALWCNHTDILGLVCATFVLCTFAFTALSMYLFYQDGYISQLYALVIVLLIALSVWCHIKVMLTDPGAVPKMAKPIPRDQNLPHVMCGRCDSYKPPLSHHDRISNRCICRMDHYCPWTNNAIGAGNQKVFILFVLYTDIAAISLYAFVAYTLLVCDGSVCTEFDGSSLLVARVLLFILVFTILFTSGMLLNQIYGLRNGMGTIDRLKLNREHFEKRDPIPFSHVFGNNWWFALIPVDPYFRDQDEVFRYRILPFDDI